MPLLNRYVWYLVFHNRHVYNNTFYWRTLSHILYLISRSFKDSFTSQKFTFGMKGNLYFFCVSFNGFKAPRRFISGNNQNLSVQRILKHFFFFIFFKGVLKKTTSFHLFRLRNEPIQLSHRLAYILGGSLTIKNIKF